ncbi:hypothetical protein TNCV_3403711 [Trichonephila clavipes]|nr:hypothetical protein TNCV_3403711 [Trichonephila clavipes]
MKFNCRVHCCTTHWQSETIVCRIQALCSLKLEEIIREVSHRRRQHSCECRFPLPRCIMLNGAQTSTAPYGQR